jgi:hypothetical protein
VDVAALRPSPKKLKGNLISTAHPRMHKMKIELGTSASGLEDDLQALIAKHFHNEDSLLCLVDTHKTPIYGMNNMPDFVFVQRSWSTTVVANAIVGVMEIKLDNQLTEA